MNQNFTPIDFLINQPQPVSVGNVEKHEPIATTNTESVTPVEAPQDEPDSVQSTDYISKHIEVKDDIPVISADVAAAGVQASTTSGVSTTSEVLELPLEDEEIPEGLKKPVSSGFRWLAEICVYMLKKAHLKIKQIHGKVMRVRDEKGKMKKEK